MPFFSKLPRLGWWIALVLGWGACRPMPKLSRQGWVQTFRALETPSDSGQYFRSRAGGFELWMPAARMPSFYAAPMQHPYFADLVFKAQQGLTTSLPKDSSFFMVTAVDLQPDSLRRYGRELEWYALWFIPTYFSEVHRIPINNKQMQSVDGFAGVSAEWEFPARDRHHFYWALVANGRLYYMLVDMHRAEQSPELAERFFRAFRLYKPRPAREPYVLPSVAESKRYAVRFPDSDSPAQARFVRLVADAGFVIDITEESRDWRDPKTNRLLRYELTQSIYPDTLVNFSNYTDAQILEQANEEVIPHDTSGFRTSKNFIQLPNGLRGLRYEQRQFSAQGCTITRSQLLYHQHASFLLQVRLILPVGEAPENLEARLYNPAEQFFQSFRVVTND